MESGVESAQCSALYSHLSHPHWLWKYCSSVSTVFICEENKKALVFKNIDTAVLICLHK